MRRYGKSQEKKLIQVICNQCGKDLKCENGYLKEGCFTADYVFGYFSTKDGIRHHFDLCEECYDKLTGSFAVPAEEAAEHELL